MNKLVRMTYGRSGSRLDRVLVAAPCRESAPPPRWLRTLEVLFWLLIPALVIRYAIPPTSTTLTLIDTSQLMEKPVEVKKPPLIEEPKPLPKIKPVVKPEKPPVEVAQKPKEIPKVQPREEVVPTIVRPSLPRAADVDYQPRITRERAMPRIEAGNPSADPRIRRSATGPIPAPAGGGVTIARTRGAVAIDAPVQAGYRVAALRNAPAAGTGSSGGGSGTGTGVVLRQSGRSGRSYGLSGTSDGGGPVITATRRTGVPGGTGNGDSSSSVGVIRGVSLMSLDICSSPQEEEDHIKAVLGVVGSRRSCTNDKGEFQFKGTERVSSFNLMIYPAHGRRPTNRCEELEYAYRCLTTH